MADLERVLGALGNRGYRDAHLEAGILGGLPGGRRARGATGLTFYDDDHDEVFRTACGGEESAADGGDRCAAVGVDAGRVGRPRLALAVLVSPSSRWGQGEGLTTIE
jgi:hypothetical protein